MRAAVEKAVRYFLTGLAVPEDDLWVNLSPYEQDRIIPDILSRTDAGLDMLEQDYLLKQLAASLTYPETEFGKAFWGRVYEKAKERFGTTDIPAQTFNKVWIVPEHSVVYETADRAVIAESRLKVMLESDYLAWKENSPLEEISPEQDISHDVMREIVVPLLEEEVNAGAHFAPLRQIYHALILSSWFKDRLKMTAVAQVYGDRGRIAGIEAQNGGSGAVEAVYQEYLKAYQEGAYDYIREEYEEETGEIIPKRYFSGGHTFTQVSETREDVPVPSQTLDRVLAGKREKPVMADIRLNSIKQKGPDQAMLGKDVVTGIGTAVFIEKQTFHPSFVALMQRLTALDYFVETLDELYESHSGWRRALRFIEALHSQKARARTILRTLISRLNADFAVFQQMSSQEFSYEMFDRFPDISPMKILYKQMADLPDGREKQQLQSKLRAVAQQPGGPEHFSLLMEAENEKLFKGRSIGGKTLYDLLRSIIDHPEQLPDIPGVSPMAFVRTAVEQREKFDKTYHFFIQQLEKDIVQAEPAEKMILEGYKRMLVDSKNVAVNQKINDAKKFYETQASRRKAEFERTVHAGEIKDEQEIARQRDKLEEELKAANERDGKRAEEIAQLAEDYVGGLFGHHADSEEAARWNRAKKTAEEALWLRRTASGYMGAVMDYVGQNVEKMRVMASADPASEGVRKVLSTLSEVHDITQTMFREVLLLWHWETQELQDIVKADSKMEHERALLKTDKYVRSMEAWGPGLSSRSEELKAAADIVYQYTTSIRNILARGDVGLEVVHSYRWAVLEQAFSETFKMKTDEEKETFRPLLSAIGHSIVLSAEMELPSADQYENVDIFIDDILTPSQYLSLYAHFKGKLRNIFTTKGTLTSHFALLAASHGVGVIILDKGVFPTGISNGQKVSVALEKKGNVLLHAVEDGAGGFKGGLMDILAKLNMEKVFARDPDSYIEANADTSDEVARAVADFFAKGIGLARSEDQLSDEDLPTRAFYRSKWLEMIRKASGKVITIRAFDWKSDKRTVMLSHVKYQGKKCIWRIRSAGRSLKSSCAP